MAENPPVETPETAAPETTPEETSETTAPEAAPETVPEETPAEAESAPRVFAFSCPNGLAATFIGEGGHGDAHGGPVIPRDVRCPVCGHNMVLREPFDLATASQLVTEVTTAA